MSAPNDGTYAVSRILQHRIQTVTDGSEPGYDYLVRWKDEENQVHSAYNCVGVNVGLNEGLNFQRYDLILIP